MGRAAVLLLIGLGVLGAGCSEVCGPRDSDGYGTSARALRTATGPGALAIPLACLFVGGGCGPDDVEIEAGETKTLETAPCSERPFPTEDEAAVTVRNRASWLEVGYEADDDGVRRFRARAAEDACDPDCPEQARVEVEIIWLPAWSAEPFADTIEVAAFDVEVEAP